MSIIPSSDSKQMNKKNKNISEVCYPIHSLSDLSGKNWTIFRMFSSAAQLYCEKPYFEKWCDQ